MAYLSNNHQKGQAMTEFQITAAFVLVPLFLIIPLMAKYIDIKHAGINAARYQAWEYTAWHNNADEHALLNNFTSATIPYKSPGVTGAESQRRIFSKITEKDPVAITSGDGSGWQDTDRNPLWTDHAGENLYQGTSLVNINTGNDTPGFTIGGFDTSIITNTALKALGLVFQAFGFILGFTGSSAEFTAWKDMEGYTRNSLQVPVQFYPGVVDVARGSTPQNFASRAGVLSEGWNSGGTDHTYQQVGGAVPTTLLNQIMTNPPMSWLWPVVEFMAPELTLCRPPFSLAASIGLIPKDGSLWLGYIDSDTVHPDRLSGGGTHVCDAAGRCRLQPNIPLSHTRCQR